ncbi:MAG: radical protein [Caulobacter sp.]|nr:radical protein [Caulobacter sp.]
MNLSRPAGERRNRTSLKIGIVDLIERQPSRTLYGRVVNANFASIMPQAVGVWAEQLGHEVEYITYTGFEDLERELPRDVDLVFVNAFTQAAYLAYSISNLYRRRGVVTVLGGPHARAYPDDAAEFFDYVIGLADQHLITALLSDFPPNPSIGLYLTAARQPMTLPGVRERWKYIEKTLAKTRIIHVVQMLGSLGCPYTCNFCIDSEIDYQTMSYDQLREDLAFLQKQPRSLMVAWMDPNFGVRFDDYMDVIESVVPPGKLQFACETSLSLLSEANLKRMKQNHFKMVFPGVESWFDYNNKAKQKKTDTGLEKVRRVADHCNVIMEYVPYLQTNLIFGWDSDTGAEPFELTKRFLDLAPGVYPKYSLLTAFGASAPLSRQYMAQDRLLDLPFQFLDGYSGINVKTKNYTHAELFGHMTDLMKYTVSAGLIWRRFKANGSAMARYGNLLRARSKERNAGAGQGMVDHYREVQQRLENDPEFLAFGSGETTRPPAYYVQKIRQALGPLYDQLPAKVLDYFQFGEAAPNTRISLSPRVRPPLTPVEAPGDRIA